MAPPISAKSSRVPSDVDVEAGRLLEPQQKFAPLDVSSWPRPTPVTKCSDLLFRAYVVLAALILWTAHSLLLRYSLRGQASQDLYAATTTVLLSEALKWLLSLAFLFKEEAFDPARLWARLGSALFGRPVEMAKAAVPSILYACQNNLDFVALARIEPSVYVVTSQLKVVTTAFMMIWLLGRSFSARRWAAMGGLMLGVALVQLEGVSGKGGDGDKDAAAEGLSEEYIVGIACVLGACFTSAFAGVWFEKILKERGTETSFWERNLQLYTSGVLMTAMVSASTEGEKILSRGFFHGYTPVTWLIIVICGLGGVYISLMMKHLDNVVKTLTSSASILLIVLGSVVFFSAKVGGMFVLGAVIVCASLLAYNSVSQ